MSYWTIPPQMQAPTPRRTVSGGRKAVVRSLFLPFLLAVLGIPIYLVAVLKLIDLIR